MMFDVLRDVISFEGEPRFLGTVEVAFGNRCHFVHAPAIHCEFY